jgi:hypothetical protein
MDTLKLISVAETKIDGEERSLLPRLQTNAADELHERRVAVQ